MHKLRTLFLSLISTSILLTLLPVSVFAQEACVPMVCPDGTRPVSATQCAASQTSNRVAPISLMCAAGKNPSNAADPSRCICNPIGGITPAAPGTGATSGTTTAPAAPAAPAAPVVLTGGRGIPCNIVSGKLENGSGIMTAIGCIPTQPQKLVEGILWYGTLASGGVAFMLMLLASITMITAEGNPNTIKTAQERFYSAIIGLLLIIFSVLLMQVIGVDILGLKGFGK